MPLTTEQKKLIVDIDNQVNRLLKIGASSKTILGEMSGLMPAMKPLIFSTDKTELNLYLQEYDGFFYFIKLLENLAQDIATDKMPMPE